MYYCFFCPPPSIVFLACHSLLIHQFASPLPTVRHILRIEVKGIIFVRIQTSNHSAVWVHVSRHANFFRRYIAGGRSLFLFQSVDLFVQTLDLLYLRYHCVD